MQKKIPYGKSNFFDVIEQGYAYVDKTRYIELLEAENNTYQFMLRPRRFGKSLFLSVLEHYYDTNSTDKFDTLFGDLYIGKNPTLEQGKYAVLRVDFSGIDTDTHEAFVKSFSSRIEIGVRNFLRKYEKIFPNAERDIEYITGLGINSMDVAYDSAMQADIPIFLLIDEYDHFANKLIATGKTYAQEVRAGGIVRTFYELVKSGTTSVIKRFFITGVTPMMLTDLSSGFNMTDDLSMLPYYNEICGFTYDEVKWLAEETGIDMNLITVDMEAYYNGYRFNIDADSKVFNSQMVLYLFNQIKKLGKQPEEVIDENLRTDYGRLRMLVENEANKGILSKITVDGEIESNIVRKFSESDLQNEGYFVSLLFYLGMLTIGENTIINTRLVIPNYSIQTLYWEYMTKYLANLESGIIDTEVISQAITKMAVHGEPELLIEYFSQHFLKRLSNRDLQKFDEKYIKAMLMTLLFVTPAYHPVSEHETTDGYTDLYLVKNHAISSVKYEYVFEIKYVKTGAKDAQMKTVQSEADAQIEKYKKDARFVSRDDVIFATLVFKGKGDVIWEIK